MNTDIDRLFVPLLTEHWEAFASGAKTCELRGVNHQYNTATVTEGRLVELRRGYSTPDSLWGRIQGVDVVDDAREIDDHDAIVPGKTRREFLESVDELLGQYDQYIAIHIPETSPTPPDQ